MSLFKLSEIVGASLQVKIDNAPVIEKLIANPIVGSGDKVSTIAEYFDNLNEGEAIYFMTDGAWSNIDLIEKLLITSGSADLYVCSWSIGTDAIRKFTEWQNSGLIKTIYVLLDQGIRNRKPEILQQCKAAFNNLKLIKCHAKVAVIRNENFHFVISGSANLTRNPRKESGTVFHNRNIARVNADWMRKEFDNV